MIPTYISFFTKNTPYEKEAKDLESSLVWYHLPHKIYEMENTGSWEKNCQLKAKVIRLALDEFITPIVWVDSDARVVRDPVFFNNLECDISMYYLKTSYNPNELLSGTLYLANNGKVISLIDQWIELNNTNSQWDQKNLQVVLEKRADLKKRPLPGEYIKIDKFDRHQPGISNPSIIHYQASRKNKKVINGNSR
jgi:hypothetical protein